MEALSALDPRALLAAGCLALGLVAGVVMHRSDYCLAGMFRDLFLFRTTRMLRMLALLVVATMVLFEAARMAGVLPYYPFLLFDRPNGAALLGGAVFGVGMVLAGGCVVGTLYRIGSGSAVSAVAFLGMLVGSGIYAEVHPVWRRVVVAAALPAPSVTLPTGLGIEPTWPVVGTAAAFALFFFGRRRRGRWVQPSAARGYLQPWKASLVLALLSLLSYGLAGMPLAVTTCYAKLAATLESLVAPEHVASLAFFQALPLDAELPRLGVRLRGGPGPGWDGIALVQGMTILGIVMGALLSSVSLGEFRPVFRVPGRQYASALLGGVLLALGSRFSLGCNVWHLLGGLPIFATQAVLFVAGLVPGAWLGSRLLVRFVLPAELPRPGACRALQGTA